MRLFFHLLIIKESTESADPGLVAKVSQLVVSFPDYHIAWEWGSLVLITCFNNALICSWAGR